MFTFPLTTKPFHPRDLPGIFAWWDLESAAVTGGVTVDTIVNTSGQGTTARNLTRVGGTGPTYTASDANFKGFPSVGSTATNRRMNATFDVALAQPATWYLVMNQGSSAATYFWRSNAGNFTDSHGLYVNSSAGAATILTQDAGLAITSVGSVGAGIHVTCATYSGAAATSALYLNNSVTAFAKYPGDGSMNTQSATAVTIGSFGSAFTHSWACMIAFSGVHDAATRQKVMKWLGNKYGIAVT